MKKILNVTTRTLVVISFVAVCAALADAQGRDQRFVSARAGGVNFVSGDVSARHEGESDWSRISVKDDLKNGDTVRTGPDGRAEVLLNPGSYFRMGEGSEFVMVSTSLDDLQLGLARGSAVIEATGYNDLDLSINVATPQAHVKIVRSGIYRLNVLPSGETEVAVLKGRALVGESNATVVKGGGVARVGKGGVELAKFDKESRDSLDLWSRDRGKELAKANENIQRRSAMMMLAHMRTDSFFDPDGLNAGIWYWNQPKGCYTFLPFYGGWGSPYGFGYFSWLYVPGGCGSCGGGYAGGWITRNGTPYGGPGTVYGGNGQPGGSGGTSGYTPPPTSTPVATRSDPPPAREIPHIERPADVDIPRGRP
jgi:FecR protein